MSSCYFGSARALGWVVSCCVIVGCSKERGPEPPVEATKPEVHAPAAVEVHVAPLEVLSPDAREAAKLRVEHFQCNRCHTIEGIEPVPVEESCVDCHAQIMAGTYEDKPELLAKWRENIVHLKVTPSLVGVDRRFSREWLIGFLQRPHDLRPRVAAQMPRMPISERDAELIADYLIPGKYAEQTLPEGASAERGAELVASKGCGTCHAMTGATLPASPIPVEVSPEAMALGMKLAPDLRHTRERFRPLALVAWLEDPVSLKPDSMMPKIPLTRAEAIDVAAYLLEAELAEPEPVAIPERLPILERRVSYAEVEAKVFKKVCWHCHSDPAFNKGDGGPGNTGGLGFEGRGLDLSSYSSVASGMRDAQGKRMSVFKKTEDGTPWIVAAMHARYAEVAGKPVEGITGMPLGLSPMTLEEIQLVESWIAQGRPRR